VRRIFWPSVMSAVLALLIATPATAAVFLGSTLKPAGSKFPSWCNGFVYAQLTSDPATPYSVPAGGAGYITQWQTNTQFAIPGSRVSFVVLHPTSAASNYVVAGFDSQSLPRSLPPSHIVTFRLKNPILFARGDLLGLWSPRDLNGASCAFTGGATPAAATIAVFSSPSGDLVVGQKVSVRSTSPPAWRVPVAALLVHIQDAAVKTLKVRPIVGKRTVLSFAVTNHGPSTLPIRFTDRVPRRLTVNAAAAQHGVCSSTGREVRCTIIGLSRGDTSRVRIVVTPRAAGRYTNTASVANLGALDPDPANNRSTTQISVARSPDFMVTVAVKDQSPGEPTSIEFNNVLLDPASQTLGATRYTATGPTQLVLGSNVIALDTSVNKASRTTNAKLTTTAYINAFVPTKHIRGTAVVPPGATVELTINEQPSVTLRNGRFDITLPPS